MNTTIKLNTTTVFSIEALTQHVSDVDPMRRHPGITPMPIVNPDCFDYMTEYPTPTNGIWGSISAALLVLLLCAILISISLIVLYVLLFQLGLVRIVS